MENNQSTTNQPIATDQVIKDGDFGLGKKINAETYDKLEKEVQDLKDGLKQEKDKIISIRQEIEKSRFDLITILGIFVGLITYLGLEVQVFKSISNPLLIIGVSIFFIASILLFILSINTIIKKYNELTWSDFKNPLFIILLFLLFFSVICINLGYTDFLKMQSVNSRIDLGITSQNQLYGK